MNDSNVQDLLAQLSKAARIDKLQQTFKTVEDDYLRLLKVGSTGVNGNGMDIDVDVDDEEEGEEEGEEEEEDLEVERPPKRIRLE
jgi:hypothetical protein